MKKETGIAEVMSLIHGQFVRNRSVILMEQKYSKCGKPIRQTLHYIFDFLN